MCECCYEISLGKDKKCLTCGVVKHITLFQQPKLLHCEQCILNPSKLKKQCDICDCAVQYKSWNDHLQTKKHRLRTYVEQPADEYQGEYDKCIACDSSFQQSDLLKDHICVKCTINGNIPKMHCDICNSDMMITNWPKHLKSKKHLNNHIKISGECCQLIEHPSYQSTS
jgi:hypothetical protein